MNKRIFVIFASAVIWAVLFAVRTGYTQEYLITPGDQLNIIIANDVDMGLDLNSKGQLVYIVQPDGEFSFPMAGKIDTTGMTVDELTALLTKRLSRYMVDPQVTINLLQLGTTRVYVLGEVNKPGLYELQKSHRFLDALGIAQGYTREAAKKEVFLYRQGQDDRPVRINLLDMLKKGDMRQNYELHEGDVLYFSSNGRIDFTRDILPFLTGIYEVHETYK